MHQPDRVLIARGKRQQVMTPGTNRRRSIFGAINLQSGQWFYQVTCKASAPPFTCFCEQLLAAYPTAPVVVVVCDSVVIHFRVNRNIPLRPDGRRVSLPNMRNNWLTG
jgi:hypothetical protein